MCEIQFVASNNSKIVAREIERLAKLGFKNGHRDATGILYDRGDDIVMAKAPKDWKNLIEGNNEIKKSLPSASFAIAHNRYTTVGTATNNENNHPFELGGFQFVHNGTFTFSDEGNKIAKEYIESQYLQDTTIETDSFKFLAVFLSKFEHLCDTDKLKRGRKFYIYEAFNDALQLVGGKFSVFLVDVEFGYAYYIRNSLKDFYFNMIQNTNNWTIKGSTTKKNIETTNQTEYTGRIFNRVHRKDTHEFQPEVLTMYQIRLYNLGNELNPETIFLKSSYEFKFDTTIGEDLYIAAGYGKAFEDDDDEEYEYLTEVEFNENFPNTNKFLLDNNADAECIDWYDYEWAGIDLYLSNEDANKFINIGKSEGLSIVQNSKYNYSIQLNDTELVIRTISDSKSIKTLFDKDDEERAWQNYL